MTILNYQTAFDMLPAFCRARILILGVGNTLFGDDGFGPAVIEYLEDQYAIPDDIYVMDVGTGVRKLLFTLTLSAAKPEEIMVVDAVDWGQEIGSLAFISADELPVSKIDDFSLHQLPTSNMLHELQGACGVTITVAACDVSVMPGTIAPGLSPTVAQAVPVAAGQIADRYDLLHL